MLKTINDSKATMNVHSITSSPQPEGQIGRSHLPLSILVENWDRVQDLIEEKGTWEKLYVRRPVSEILGSFLDLLPTTTST